MKEMDNIEQLFSSEFSEEKVTPPTSVKESIDKVLFPDWIPTLWIIESITLLIGIGSFIWMINRPAITTDQNTATNSTSAQYTSSNHSTHTGNGNSNQSGSLSTFNTDSSNSNTAEQHVDVTNNNQSTTSNGQSSSTTNRRDKSLWTDKSLKNSRNAVAHLSSDGKNNNKKPQGSGTPNTLSYTPTTSTSSASGSGGENNSRPSQGGNNNTDSSTGSTSANSDGDNMASSNSEKPDRKNGGVIKTSSGSGKTETDHSGNTSNSSDSERPQQNLSASETDDLLALRTKKVTSISSMNLPELQSFLKPPGKSTKIPLSLSLYGGMHFGQQKPRTSIPNLQMQQNRGFNTSLEVSTRIKPSFGVTAGIDFRKRSLRFNQMTIQSIDSTDNSYWDVVWNDVDSTFDSTWVPLFQLDTTYGNFALQGNSINVSVPIYFSYYRTLYKQFSLKLNAGVRLGYTKFTTTLNETTLGNPIQKQFRIDLLARPEIIYSFQKMGVGIYGSVGYTFTNNLRWQDVGLPRFRYGMGLSLHYHF